MATTLSHSQPADRFYGGEPADHYHHDQHYHHQHHHAGHSHTPPCYSNFTASTAWQSPSEYEYFSPPSPPPVPPKEPLRPRSWSRSPSPSYVAQRQHQPHQSQLQLQPQHRQEQYLQPVQPPSPVPSIEPDPLPPHSNPQALTQTQSLAFTSSEPIPALRLARDAIRDAATGLPAYTVSRSSGNESTVMVTRESAHPSEPATGIIRFPTPSSRPSSSSSSSCPSSSQPTTRVSLTMRGRTTSLALEGFWRERWAFTSTRSAPPANTNQNNSNNNNSNTTTGPERRYHWKQDKSSNGAVLVFCEAGSGSGGQCLARLRGDLLSFETARLGGAGLYEEVIVSALAITEVGSGRGGCGRAGADGTTGRRRGRAIGMGRGRGRGFIGI